MAMTLDVVMTLRGVSRRFRRGSETVVALDDLNLELCRGELTVAAGPSGSGKTTLLSILAGIDVADAGTVTTHPPLPAGVPPASLGWRHLAFVPQALALLDELTVEENIDAARLFDPDATPTALAAHDLLERLEIGHLAGRYPSHTSGGEQQRAALARALRLVPAVLVADEPTGHQDRDRIDLLLGILHTHAYAGNAVLLASHDEAVISSADRVLTLADGRLISDVRALSRSYPR